MIPNILLDIGFRVKDNPKYDEQLITIPWTRMLSPFSGSPVSIHSTTIETKGGLFLPYAEKRWNTVLLNSSKRWNPVLLNSTHCFPSNFTRWRVHNFFFSYNRPGHGSVLKKIEPNHSNSLKNWTKPFVVWDEPNRSYGSVNRFVAYKLNRT